jgi:hypothetical protein
MTSEGKKLLAVAIAAVLVAASSPSVAEKSSAHEHLDMQSAHGLSSEAADIRLLKQILGERVLAVGRLDGADVDNSMIKVLGTHFIVTAVPQAQEFLAKAHVGDAVVLVGDITEDGAFVDDGFVLPGLYVPGASAVYLRGYITGGGTAEPLVAVGGQPVVLGDAASDPSVASFSADEFVEILGTQPSIEGVILAAEVSPIELNRDASVGTGKTDASVGTGKTDASVGTGKTDASVGTGKTDASVGTGKTDGFAVAD